LLQALAARLHAVITTDFGGAAFVKLGDTAPKDTSPPDTLLQQYHARRLASAPAASNAALAAYVWARARVLRITSGVQAMELLTRSGRAAEELERRELLGAVGLGGGGPHAVEDGALNITLREWAQESDPGLEFRCFVVRDKLVAVSDMASQVCRASVCSAHVVMCCSLRWGGRA
jgi:hypothetical protein